MRRTWVLCAMVATVAGAQTSSVSGIPKNLEGGGRVCYGHFTHTDSRLSWKAVYSSCSSPFTVATHEGLHWVLKVKRSKACAYEAIVVTGVNPAVNKQGMWAVTGYSRMADIDKPGAESYWCGMLVYAKEEKTVATAVK